MKKLICEIQVRTVLQDAWAIIDHHLIYKQESDVPKILRRKLNSLAGLIETADDQFDQVRKERQEYRRTVKTNLSGDDAFLNQEVNLDNLIEFLTSRFPDRPVRPNDSGISRIRNRALKYGYKTLLDLDQLLRRTEKARKALSEEFGTPIARGELARAIAFENPSFRRDGKWKYGGPEVFDKYEKWVEPNPARLSSKRSRRTQ